MTKIKRERKKYHTAALNKKPEFENSDQAWNLPLKFEQNNEIVPSIGLFEGIKVNTEDLLKQKLPDFDSKSIISNKTTEQGHLSKKEKRKQRHEAFLHKIEIIKQARKEEKEKRKRKMTPVVGDLNPLVEALPSLQELLVYPSGKAKNKPNVQKFKSIKKATVREREMKNDIKLFQQVLKHPAFKENPDATITEHLQNTIQSHPKRMDTT